MRSPIPVILDSNIYDLLAVDAPTAELIRRKVDGATLEVIVTRTIAEELWLSPFKGVPPFFRTLFRGNTVGRADLMTCIDSIGPGHTFDAHLGKSRKINDALIADAADWLAQWLMSADDRLRSQMAKVATRCRPLSYDQFVAELGKL